MNFNYLSASLCALTLCGTLAAQTIVTVNGTKIDSSEIERRAKIFQTNSHNQVQDGPDLRNAITEELITEILVTQEAKRLKLDQDKSYKTAEAESLKAAKTKGLDKEKDFKQNWADYQNQLLMMAFAENLFAKQPISEEQIKKKYDSIRDHYQNSDEVQLGEIYTNQPNQTQTVLKELAAKKNFLDIATKYSINPEAKQNGGIVDEYVPLIDLKENNQEVYQAVANLNKGQYTKTPLQDGNINLILYVNNKRPVQIPDYNEIKEGIAQSMRNEILSQEVDKLGKNAQIIPAQ